MKLKFYFHDNDNWFNLLYVHPDKLFFVHIAYSSQTY